MLNLLGGRVQSVQVSVSDSESFHQISMSPPSSPPHWLEPPMNSLYYYAASAWSLLSSADQRLEDDSLQSFPVYMSQCPGVCPVCAALLSPLGLRQYPQYMYRCWIFIGLIITLGGNTKSLIYCKNTTVQPKIFTGQNFPRHTYPCIAEVLVFKLILTRVVEITIGAINNVITNMGQKLAG